MLLVCAVEAASPFPSPTCLPPCDYEDDGVVQEAPTGVASTTGATVWKAADTPMRLAAFDDITRRALMRW